MTDMPPLDHLQLSAFSAEQVLRLVQITDCHLGEQSGERLVGMDTDSSLDHVLTLIQEEQPAAHLLLFHWRFSQSRLGRGLSSAKGEASAVGLPYAWLAGNHDRRDLMVDTVGNCLLPRTVRAGRWLIVMMDSAVPGQVGGELGEQELVYLEQALSAHADADYVIACLHHQPIPIGCDWLDEQRLADSNKLLAILCRESRMRAMLWGHVHQAFSGQDARLPGVQLLSAPQRAFNLHLIAKALNSIKWRPVIGG